ncbi:VPLPA-CTERM sorting domain-containing protein [Limimaricola litoreus]|uniref:VPLPA-CTERM sorting domain-containing protein n=1 Tax=Limimaricola litoreus TaxID=2955316 RepID=A0A9X2FNP1_9RHOB|nr:VPLPA-CTERM sorting domain-containing protein [Limimaricola litoreus]MCP1168371.1 VPLPA-CTERM sorting domain-containing protein [Limimaricola litoreus]
MTKHSFFSALAAICLAAPASATVIQFGAGDWVYNNTAATEQPKWIVKIDDETDATRLFFQVALDPTTPSTGDVLGLGFSSSIPGIASTDIQGFTSPTGDGVTNFLTNTSKCGTGPTGNGGGCKFDAAQVFDYMLRIGDTGSASGLNNDFSFYINKDVDLDTTTFSAVGIRAQTVGAPPTGGGGSTKDYNLKPECIANCGDDAPPPNPVPLPAAGWLLLAALGGTAGLRRFRKTG